MYIRKKFLATVSCNNLLLNKSIYLLDIIFLYFFNSFSIF